MLTDPAAEPRAFCKTPMGKSEEPLTSAKCKNWHHVFYFKGKQHTPAIRVFMLCSGYFISYQHQLFIQTILAIRIQVYKENKTCH